MELVTLNRSNIDDILEFEEGYAPDKPLYARASRKTLEYIFDHPNSGAYGVFEGNKLIAWGAYKSESGVYEVDAIVVAPDFQGKGIGKEILDKLLVEIRKNKDVKEIWLSVHPQNKSALSLYLKSGFVISEHRENMYGPGEDRLILKLNKSS